MKRVILFPALICIQGFTGCSNSNLLGNLDPGAKSQGADSHPEVVINDYHPLDLQSNFLAINGKSAAAGFSVALSAHGRSRNIHIYRLSSGNYAYDLDLDGEVDFQVQPLSRDYKRVNYLDENGKIFGKGSIQISGNRARLRFEPIAATISNPQPPSKGQASLKEVPSSKKSKYESWREEFQQQSGKPEVVAAVAVAAFAGPEGPAVVYACVAAYCLGRVSAKEEMAEKRKKPPKEVMIEPSACLDCQFEEPEKRKEPIPEKTSSHDDIQHDIRENQYKK
ncbi:MAG: hypothetical protein V6Z82_02300 [Flavobacteriales bacterium]